MHVPERAGAVRQTLDVPHHQPLQEGNRVLALRCANVRARACDDGAGWQVGGIDWCAAAAVARKHPIALKPPSHALTLSVSPHMCDTSKMEACVRQCSVASMMLRHSREEAWVWVCGGVGVEGWAERRACVGGVALDGAGWQPCAPHTHAHTPSLPDTPSPNHTHTPTHSAAAHLSLYWMGIAQPAKGTILPATRGEWAWERRARVNRAVRACERKGGGGGAGCLLRTHTRARPLGLLAIRGRRPGVRRAQARARAREAAVGDARAGGAALPTHPRARRESHTAASS